MRQEAEVLEASKGEVVNREEMTFDIELFFDTSCPYCFVGKSSLESAIESYRAQYPDTDFNLVWRPFILYPMAKVAAISKKTPWTLKYGEDALAFFEKMDTIGAGHGVRFLWEGTTGNTSDSHKLILMAREKDKLLAQYRPPSSPSPCVLPGEPQNSSHHPPDSQRPDAMAMETTTAQSSQRSSRGRPHTASNASPASSRTASASSQTQLKLRPRHHVLQDATISAIYQGGFEHGRDVSDREFLAAVAVSTGLAANSTEALALMDSPVADALVGAGTARAAEIGITAVPSFVVQGKYRVGGYQRPDVFVALFDKIRRLKGEGKQ